MLGCCWPGAQGDPACIRCSAARGPRSSRASAWGSRSESRPSSTRSIGTSTKDTAGSSSRSRRDGMSTWSGGSASDIRDRRSRSTPTRPTRSTTCPRSRQLDDFDLLLIEQPLAHDDIIDHARLQAALKTPICLDESIHSADDARKALDLGACRVINIKVSRVGRPARGEAGPRPLPRPGCPGLVRRDARVRDRPGGQRGHRRPARLHAPRRCLRLGQILSPRTSSSRRSWPSTERFACSTDPAWASSRSRDASRPGPCVELDAEGMRGGRHGSTVDCNGSIFRAEASTMLSNDSSSWCGLRVAQPRQGGPRSTWGTLLANRLRSLGVARSRSSPTPRAATICSRRFPGPADRKPALVLGHFDTVWPRGTIERMPSRVEGDSAPSARASTT